MEKIKTVWETINGKRVKVIVGVDSLIDIDVKEKRKVRTPKKK
jgi:hypothetical protein